MKIAPIPSYLIYDGFEKNLDASIVYERLMDIIETPDMHSHALTFMRSLMIRKWRLNNVKTLLTSSTVLWNYTPRFKTVGTFAIQPALPYTAHGNGIISGTCTYRASTKAKIHQQIPPPQMNTAWIPLYQLYASVIQALLTQSTSI